MPDNRTFIVATPGRSPVDPNARALHRHGLLRFLALGTRRGIAGVPPEYTRLNPKIGLVNYAAARTLSVYRAESFRFRLNPWFDHWVKKQMQPGDRIISSYGYANACFRYAREHGGKTFLDGGNSHPDNFWTIITEEHKRWNCPLSPVARHHYERSLRMLPDVDYVLAPSTFVSNSFLERGFKPEQIIRNVYPTDLSCFKPRTTPRKKDQPLTIISTGALSLRKGCPYLLEGFKLALKHFPTARLRLNNYIHDTAKPILEKYRDLPIDWSPGLPHAQLAERLQSSDIFVMPSLEEGLVRTALEAMACGLPAILTPNTGSAEYVKPGVNGEVVPIRDARAIADAIIKWGDLILSGADSPKIAIDTAAFSVENFETNFIQQLKTRRLA